LTYGACPFDGTTGGRGNTRDPTGNPLAGLRRTRDLGRMDAMRQRLAAVRAATAAIRPALMHFYEALDQGQKVRFAGMS
jgi:hypothetical protein